MHAFPPNFRFSVTKPWLPGNGWIFILVALSLLTCVALLLVESQVTASRPQSTVSVGSGLFLIASSGVMSFFAAASSIQR